MAELTNLGSVSCVLLILILAGDAQPNIVTGTPTTTSDKMNNRKFTVRINLKPDNNNYGLYHNSVYSSDNFQSPFKQATWITQPWIGFPNFQLREPPKIPHNRKPSKPPRQDIRDAQTDGRRRRRFKRNNREAKEPRPYTAFLEPMTGEYRGPEGIDGHDMTFQFAPSPQREGAGHRNTILRSGVGLYPQLLSNNGRIVSALPTAEMNIQHNLPHPRGTFTGFEYPGRRNVKGMLSSVDKAIQQQRNDLHYPTVPSSSVHLRQTFGPSALSRRPNKENKQFDLPGKPVLRVRYGEQQYKLRSSLPAPTAQPRVYATLSKQPVEYAKESKDSLLWWPPRGTNPTTREELESSHTTMPNGRLSPNYLGAKSGKEIQLSDRHPTDIGDSPRLIASGVIFVKDLWNCIDGARATDPTSWTNYKWCVHGSWQRMRCAPGTFYCPTRRFCCEWHTHVLDRLEADAEGD